MNRRVRGVLRTALTWSAGWGFLGFVVSGLQAASLRASGVMLPISGMRLVATVALRWTVAGGITGTVFALVLWYAGRRVGSLRELSSRNTAMWGAAAGAGAMLLPGVLTLLLGGQAVDPLMARLVFLPVGAAIGAVTAAGALTMARRAPELSDGLPAAAALPPRSGGVLRQVGDRL